VVLLICFGNSALDVVPGLAGTEYDFQRGLSDKQLAMLRWMAHMAEVPKNGSNMTWDGFNVDPMRQLDMDSLRYSLAFIGYATSGMTYQHTPAYREVASSVLHDLFQRMVHPYTWQYWSQAALCGMPWKKFCAKHKTSMCTVDNVMYHHGADCPDPVREANIMYSGHLAQIALLYQLHSHDASLSTSGWRFQGGKPHVDLNYTLPALMAVLGEQSNASRVGGGITCEPGSIYPSCNNHIYISFRLHDALQGTSLGRRAGEWYGYMVNRTYNISHIFLRRSSDAKRPRSQVQRTAGDSTIEWRRRKKHNASNDPLFRIISVPPLARYIHDRNGIPFEGCASHDGWVLSWLNAWSPSNQTTSMMQAWIDVVQANLHLDAYDPRSQNITGGWLNDTCKGQDNHLTSLLASSWVPLVANQLVAPDNTLHASPGAEQLSASIYTHFEKHYATLGDSVGDGRARDMFWYRTNTTVEVLATANLALSMALAAPNQTMAHLFGPEVVKEYNPDTPVLSHVAWPAVMVRRARYLPASLELSFTVLPSRDPVQSTTLICEGYDALLPRKIRVWRNGSVYSHWSNVMVNGKRQLQIQTDVRGDTMFRVTWS